MDANQALRDTENTLRDFIAERLAKVFGPAWEQHMGVDDSRIEKWSARRVAESARLKGCGIEERIIYYSDFYDISTILRKNWEHFKDALIDIKVMELWLKELERYRDLDAHRRELFAYQKHLILGISGEVRSRIVRYRSALDNVDSHFPRLESVRSSLGQSWTPGNTLSVAHNAVTVRVGDVVEFVVTATDPEGEDLEFGYLSNYESTWGPSNCFQHKFVESDIGRSKEFIVVIRSPRKFHAHGSWDDMAMFSFHVIPSKS